MNGKKFATGEILRKSVEVAKGRILGGWAPKSPEPCWGTCGNIPQVLALGKSRVSRPQVAPSQGDALDHIFSDPSAIAY